MPRSSGQQLAQACALPTGESAFHLLQHAVIGRAQNGRGVGSAAGGSTRRPHIALRQHWRRQEAKQSKNAQKTGGFLKNCQNHFPFLAQAIRAIGIV